MSLIDHGQIIIDYISFRKTKIRKQKFEKYLSILYDSLKSTCGFTKEVFLFLFPNIPYLIREKFYELLLKKRIEQIQNKFTKQIFIETFLSIMYCPTKFLFKLFLDFFDYTNDSIIYCDDINVLFYHIHHHNGNSDKLIYVKKFISDVFSYKKFLKKKEFKYIIKEKNSNLFYLFIFSLLHSLFKKKDIYEACENLYTDLDIKVNPLLLIKEESLYEKFEIVSPTQDLIEYLNQKYRVKLTDKNPIIIEDNEDNSLDELNNFEQDVIFIKHNFSNESEFLSDINIRNIFKKPLKTYTEKKPSFYSFPSRISEHKKIKIRLSFSPSMKEEILSQFRKKLSYPRKNFNLGRNKKRIKSKTKELTLSFVKSTLKSNTQGKIHRKKIYPKDVVYPLFESILYFTNKTIKDIILRVFESFIILEDDFSRRIIPTTKLFYSDSGEPKEYNNSLLFPLKLISQLSYQKKVLYNLYFLSFQNREKFVYQLKCILGDFTFNKQFILDKLIFKSNQYSIYLGRKKNIDESTVIKIKNSRLDEFDEYENSERFHIKIISKNHIDNLKNLIDEIEISKLLSNITYPNINNIENIYEDNDNIYIIFEQFYGDTISSYENYTLTEKYELVKQLYKGVKNLHNIGIIHTNLIPELIFVNDFQQILITHINEAHLNLLFESNSLISKNVKNYKYDCPEIIEHKKCNFKVDYWNIGLITFYLLYGFFPIDKDNYYTFDIEKIIKELNWSPDNKTKKKIDDEKLLKSLNSLIINCINKDPEDRGDEIENILNIKKTPYRIKVG